MVPQVATYSRLDGNTSQSNNWANGDSHGPFKFVLVVFLPPLILLLLFKGDNPDESFLVAFDQQLAIPSLSVKCSVHLCNKKLLPLPTGANWPHLLQQMSMVYFPFVLQKLNSKSTTNLQHQFQAPGVKFTGTPIIPQ